MAKKLERVSVAIAQDDLEWARKRAERDGTSLSSVLAEAIRSTRERERTVARQRTAVGKYVTWATRGKGLSAKAIEAARRELAGE